MLTLDCGCFYILNGLVWYEGAIDNFAQGAREITITLLSECALIMREARLLLANSDLLKQVRYQMRRLVLQSDCMSK